MAFDVGVFLLVAGSLVELIHHLARLRRGAAAVNLVFALAAAVLFGTGAYLLLHRDLVRVVLRRRTDLTGRGPDARRLGPSAARRRSIR